MSDIEANNNDDINNLFIDDSDSTTDSESNGNIKINFTSSENSNYQSIGKIEQVALKTNLITYSNSNDTNSNLSHLINATNGIKLIDNIKSKRSEIYQNKISKSESSEESKSSATVTTYRNEISSLVENMMVTDNVNGWDSDANLTIKNWYHTFRQQSYIYQWVLDYNDIMSERLAIASILTSSILGIFTGFKLWIGNNTFQTTSDVISLLTNFAIALITAMSRRYGDDKRSDSIRHYITQVDEFLGEISAQVLKSPVYRMNADDFFKKNNDKYTELITSAPNMTLDELNTAKKEYSKYIEQANLNV